MYRGPDPKTINAEWESHTDAFVTCLLDGSRHQEISVEYLRMLGYSKAKYLREFNNAPLKSRDSLNKIYEMDDHTRSERSIRMSQMNRDPQFRNRKQSGIQTYYKKLTDTDKKIRSKNLKWQWENLDQRERVLARYDENWTQSEDYKLRKKRMIFQNPNRLKKVVRILSDKLKIDQLEYAKPPSIVLNGEFWQADIMINNKVFYIQESQTNPFEELLKLNEYKKLNLEYIVVIID